MMKLMFYWGPGDIVTKAIRLITAGPYSHVELQFPNGNRFFSSGHGLHLGSHMLQDHRIYGPGWDAVYIKATKEQVLDAEGWAFMMAGHPFDWKGMVSFLFPFFKRHHRGRYCSSMVLEILQRTLHLYPGVEPKLSPNGLYRLFIHNPDRNVTLDVSKAASG